MQNTELNANPMGDLYHPEDQKPKKRKKKKKQVTLVEPDIVKDLSDKAKNSYYRRQQ
jgi:hypothetical protein